MREIITASWLVSAGCNPENKAIQTPEKADWMLDAVNALGPYNIGHQSITQCYTPLDGWEERCIVIDAWYPTEDKDGDPAAYVIGIDDLAFENATAATPQHTDGYPVHVHSHGYQGWGATSAFLMRHFCLSWLDRHRQNPLTTSLAIMFHPYPHLILSTDPSIFNRLWILYLYLS